MISTRGIAATAMFIAAATAHAATPAPADTEYPSMLKLAVDATDLDHRVFRVREEIPVAAMPRVEIMREVSKSGIRRAAS